MVVMVGKTKTYNCCKEKYDSTLGTGKGSVQIKIMSYSINVLS